MSSQSIRIQTTALPWTQTSMRGVEIKPLHSEEHGSNREICVVRLAAGASLPARSGCGQEVLVLDGRWAAPGGTLERAGYSRRPTARAGDNSTTDGCTLFVRNTRFATDDEAVVHLPHDEQAWLPGQGGLRVRPLHSIGTAGTALVHWPRGERFLPHRHMGGEEIFVISGVFEDEHGRYPSGTWMSSPHLSSHHPFVREETVIFVKTGHLPTSTLR